MVASARVKRAKKPMIVRAVKQLGDGGLCELARHDGVVVAVEEAELSSCASSSAARRGNRNHAKEGHESKWREW